MTTPDHGSIVVPMLTCDLRGDSKYPSLILAMRDMRRACGRHEVTGHGPGNESWIGLAVAMIVLDTLSGSAVNVGARWNGLLTRHGIIPDDATIIYKLRCSLLHGWGIPRSSEIAGRKLLLTPAEDAYALDTSQPELAFLSVPVFCRCLVERIAHESPDDWDVSQIDTDHPSPTL